jgi:hypothetical protein
MPQVFKLVSVNLEVGLHAEVIDGSAVDHSPKACDERSRLVFSNRPDVKVIPSLATRIMAAGAKDYIYI